MEIDPGVSRPGVEIVEHAVQRRFIQADARCIHRSLLRFYNEFRMSERTEKILFSGQFAKLKR